MRVPIRDSRQIPIAYMDEHNGHVRLFDKYGSKLLGTYNPHTDKTYTADGRLVGQGNLLPVLINS